MTETLRFLVGNPDDFNWRSVKYSDIPLIMQLLCDVMNALDEDFVPGPKLAELENRFHALTGLHRGDEL
mgnify:CR=1 FL=1